MRFAALNTSYERQLRKPPAAPCAYGRLARPCGSAEAARPHTRPKPHAAQARYTVGCAEHRDAHRLWQSTDLPASWHTGLMRFAALNTSYEGWLRKPPATPRAYGPCARLCGSAEAARPHTRPKPHAAQARYTAGCAGRSDAHRLWQSTDPSASRRAGLMRFAALTTSYEGRLRKPPVVPCA